VAWLWRLCRRLGLWQLFSSQRHQQMGPSLRPQSSPSKLRNRRLFTSNNNTLVSTILISKDVSCFLNLVYEASSSSPCAKVCNTSSYKNAQFPSMNRYHPLRVVLLSALCGFGYHLERTVHLMALMLPVYSRESGFRNHRTLSLAVNLTRPLVSIVAR
jgi:hypothetical protein